MTVRLPTRGVLLSIPGTLHATWGYRPRDPRAWLQLGPGGGRVEQASSGDGRAGPHPRRGSGGSTRSPTARMRLGRSCRRPLLHTECFGGGPRAPTHGRIIRAASLPTKLQSPPAQIAAVECFEPTPCPRRGSADVIVDEGALFRHRGERGRVDEVTSFTGRGSRRGASSM